MVQIFFYREFIQNPELSCLEIKDDRVSNIYKSSCNIYRPERFFLMNKPYKIRVDQEFKMVQISREEIRYNCV